MDGRLSGGIPFTEKNRLSAARFQHVDDNNSKKQAKRIELIDRSIVPDLITAAILASRYQYACTFAGGLLAEIVRDTG